MNLYEDSINNTGTTTVASGADSYSVSIHNNINNMSLANNCKDLSNMPKSKKRRIVIKLFERNY